MQFGDRLIGSERVGPGSAVKPGPTVKPYSIAGFTVGFYCVSEKRVLPGAERRWRLASSSDARTPSASSVDSSGLPAWLPVPRYNEERDETESRNRL